MPDEETNEVKKGLSKKAKARIIILIIIVLFVAIVAYIFSTLNKPAVAQLQSGKSTSITPYKINLTPKLQVGKYISFDYPSSMLSVPVQVTGQSVEDFSFSLIDVESWFLAVDVSNARYGKLTDSTAYTTRANNPTVYAESHAVIGGQTVDIMTDKTAPGFAEIGFVLHGNLLASVSLFGDDTTGVKPLQTTFDMVLGSLHWLKS